jgi:hypothetical protein
MFTPDEILEIRTTNTKADPTLSSDVKQLLTKLNEVYVIILFLAIDQSGRTDPLALSKTVLKRYATF